MKIKSINLEKHPILGDFNLNFCDANGLPFDTILLAGENGTGKSTLLNIIYNFLNLPIPNKVSHEKQTFVFEINKEELDTLYTSEDFKKRMQGFSLTNELTVTIDHSNVNNWNSIKPSISREGGTPIEFSGFIFSQGSAKTIFKSVFSDVEVNYTPGQIRTTSSLDVDVATQLNVKSSSNLATEITQLLIDIEALDSSEFAEWAGDNLDKVVSEGIRDKRMSRFKNAFNYMFSNKRFKKVLNTPEGKMVLFEEHGNEISLNNLSSGEKQIVFRGSFLLKDKFSTQGAVVFIDEPEISLHPNWQLKILDFYKTLFLNEDNIQTSQLIVATHSPFVIHNKNQEKDKIIILGKNESGVYVQQEPTFYGWTPEQAITQAFDIQLDYERDKLVVFVEGPTDEKYINKALEVFEKSDLPVIVQWVGRKDVAGDKFTGDSALNHTKEYVLSNANIFNNKFLLLYDSDTNTKDMDFEEANLYVRKSPKNEENELFKIGVENLLTLPSDFPSNDFYISNEKIDEYGGSTFTRKLNKVALCEWVCNQLDKDQQIIYLSKIESEIITIIEEVNNKKLN
ncbi:ATP-binding protein [Mesobacillus selenatarsenatis]|uniref:Putative ATP-binding protein n=1 Tax=Mesobacillus selenatarsenatis (strain DSM 18680 / JCM 14380 / FERM P-15431 / SF-1) TaxID=1321606 RepID=A0A0A8X434_MESS1|nr:ATP-binding protein [Mesobacillus selenatarsenatis]GAM12871.1 putative ATP-binding protein [Mesobacillus selenatarsenatis SF-1]